MSVVAPAGFEAAGTACGIKDDGAADLALLATADRRPVAAAAVFTTNRACAAPVQVSREHVADGRAGAVIVNSGNANAATGEPGRRVARESSAAVASALGLERHDVLVASTGLIGVPLPLERVTAAVPDLVAGLGSGAGDATVAADAILTTDTVRKEAVATVSLPEGPATVGGMAKGAAMLAPAHATMLAFLTTDVPVEAAVLRPVLAEAVAGTFDRITVDGARSTNDTVMVLASGAAGGTPVRPGSEEHTALRDALARVCGALAEQMVRDAEGATKLVRVLVTGARDDVEADVAARRVAQSQLVKCSWYGRDPYWGRVLSELGASGVVLDPEAVTIGYGDVTVCRDGVGVDHDAEALAAVMASRELELRCDLAQGPGTASVLTTDLTHAYVDENMGTS